MEQGNSALSKNQELVSRGEIEVYAAAVRYVYGQRDLPVVLGIAEDVSGYLKEIEAAGGIRFIDLINEMPGLDWDTLVGFQGVMDVEKGIGKELTDIENVCLVSRERLSDIFGEGSWEEFYNVFPKASGLVSFSRVGFNASGTQALLYVDQLSGGLSGLQYFLFFEKDEESVWIVRERVITVEI